MNGMDVLKVGVKESVVVPSDSGKSVKSSTR